MAPPIPRVSHHMPSPALSLSEPAQWAASALCEGVCVWLPQVRPKMKQADFTIGFVLQSETDEEMPEQMLYCCNINKLDTDRLVTPRPPLPHIPYRLGDSHTQTRGHGCVVAYPSTCLADGAVPGRRCSRTCTRLAEVTARLMADWLRAFLADRRSG